MPGTGASSDGPTAAGVDEAERERTDGKDDERFGGDLGEEKDERADGEHNGDDDEDDDNP